MFENSKGCARLEKECSKTGNLVILFKKVCKSAIAHRTTKKEPHAQFQKPFRTHSPTPIPRAEVR